MSAPKGFTLVELLVTISILSILAAIGLVTFANVQKIARDGKRTSDLQSAQKAIEIYKAANGSYPAAPANNNLDSIAASSFSGHFQGGIVPKDPSTTPLSYKYYLCDTGTNQNLKFAVCTPTFENCSGKCNDNGVTWTNTATCTYTYQTTGTRYCLTN